MLKAGQARRPQGLETLWEKYGGHGQPTIMFPVMNLNLERKQAMQKKH